MTDPFLAAVAFTLKEEGGLVDDSHDPGGITKYGITIPDLTRWRGVASTAQDIIDLTVDEATTIFRALYWHGVRADDLPLGVSLSVFDHGVNRGIGTSARILQRAVSTVADGIVGPLTLAAAREMDRTTLLARLYAAQLQDYQRLNNARYEHGWLARADARNAAARGVVG